MIIKCFRCQREIESPNASNADYIMAEDVPDNKTAIVCPECYKGADAVIWGAHKNEMAV